jgi:serine phosphatase RsbU (regulator of sigma subunit)
VRGSQGGRGTTGAREARASSSAGVEAAPGQGVALGLLLDMAEDAAPVEAVEAVTRTLCAQTGATEASFLIADLSGRALVRLAHVVGADLRPAGREQDGVRWDLEESAAVLPFDGGPAEQVVRTQTLKVLPPDVPGGQWAVLAPVTERGEMIGLLEMRLPAEPTSAWCADIVRTAHVLAFVVIANRRHTDLFEWSQRSTPFSLPAEIQRRLLPAAFTCEGGAFTLSGWLEPAASVGGDSFDYSVARHVLHLSLTDAMGHGVASALIATLGVGSLRNTRRLGGTLVEQAVAANLALFEHAEELATEGFVTGLLGRLDLRTGVIALVNAGHIAPFLARAGRVTRVELPVDLPLGIFGDSPYRTTDLQLEPGDRLVLVTDGMLERSAAALDLIDEIGQTGALHPREATRQLADNVLAVAGPDLADDATLLVLDWHGQHGRDRVTVGGSDAGAGGATGRT